MPIFWRILLTNVVFVLGGGVLATAIVDSFMPRGTLSSLAHAALISAALVISALVIWLGVRHTFRPLRELRRAIERFEAGDASARARLVGGDPDTRAVAAAVNSLWDELQRTNAVVAEQNRRLSALTAQVISAQEAERKRIARELHDEAGQALTTLIIGLERGEQAMQGPELDGPRRTVARLRDLAVGTLDEIRNLALDLRPSQLDDLGLVAALRWYARTCAARAELPVDLDVAGLDERDRLAPEVETTVFRIVQEGLTNVLKHARASHAWVRLRRDGGGLTVEVEDDGVGLGGAERDGHLGLFGMEERAHLVGGDVEIGPRTGGGTRVRLTMPLPARETVVA